jgi:poly(hydroxyalkanoate) depolymerase family esterase
MTSGLQPRMAEALRLTRAGRLVEAAALLKSGLTGAPDASAPVPPTDLKPAKRSAAPRLPSARSGHAAPQRTKGSASFGEHNYQGAAGQLGYWLYSPADAKAGMPVVVMLHGCTQSPQDFALGTGMNRLADEFGFLVIYPGQTRSANAQKCWNWFRPGDQQRDGGEPALIAGITREVISRLGADASRVFVAGLSAGGAAAAIMAAAYPDLYAAAGVHSGLACGSARDLPSALGAMRSGGGHGPAARPGARFVPVITFHGDSDSTVHEINSREIVAAASQAAGGHPTTRIEKGRSAAGRSYTRALTVDSAGRTLIEQWTVHGLAHAWSGGDRSGSYTDPNGPDASREMVRFFLEQAGARASA